MDRRHVDLVGPTLLIGIGAILLLNNVGYLDWTVWDVIRLWPILLVSAGLEVLVGRRSLWGSVAAAAVIVTLIGGAIWLGGTTGLGRPRGSVEEISYDLSDAEGARIRLEPAVGRVEIDALADSANLIEGTVGSGGHSGLDRYHDAGDPAELTLSTRSNGAFVAVGLNPSAVWDLSINGETDLDLAVDLGIGDAAVDLGDLAVDEADFEFGIGSVTMILPRTGDASVGVDGGIGTVSLTVPEGAGVRIVLDSGLVGRSLPDHYRRDGDTYTSPNYLTADTTVDVRVGLGIGSIRVVQE